MNTNPQRVTPYDGLSRPSYLSLRHSIVPAIFLFTVLTGYCSYVFLSALQAIGFVLSLSNDPLAKIWPLAYVLAGSTPVLAVLSIAARKKTVLARRIMLNSSLTCILSQTMFIVAFVRLVVNPVPKVSGVGDCRTFDGLGRPPYGGMT